MPTLFKQLQAARDQEPEPGPPTPVTSVASRRSSSSKMGVNQSSLARVEARREFLRTTTKGSQDEVYTNPESLPSLEMAYNTFQRVYPKFSETWPIDEIRDREYYHLEDSEHVCMDYCGVGLFSYYQQVVNKATSCFGLAYISANLSTHALYGAPDEGTTESYIRKRVMDYLNINDAEYSMVFTASRGSAFKLLAESYPFHLNPRLLTVYDFESEAVSWMAECAKQKGAKIMSACFKWPSLRIGTSHLKKLLQEKKKKGDSAKGLFVFPVQSRMTGAKYSYQWMSQAQQNRWHVLLDASALGPKDMDSLGLSLFRPDFIVSSFYKVFGTDPTGFGCLFIKNTVIHSLHNSSRARAVGMVRIVSLNKYATDEPDIIKESEDDDGEEFQKNPWGLEQGNVHATSSFSGPYFTHVEAELRTEDVPKANNQGAWNSWKRNGKMASYNNDYSGTLTGSSVGPMDTVSEIDEGDASEDEYEAQLTNSRYYSETRASESDEESPVRWALPRRPNGGTVNEIRELGDDSVSQLGNRLQFTDPQLRLQGTLSEIEEEDKTLEFRSFSGQRISPIREEDVEEDKTLEFQSFSGQRISPIREEDVEDLEIEELEESGLSSKAHDAANRSGGAHFGLSDGRPDGRASEIEGDVFDLERNSPNVLSDIEEEAVEAGENMKWDSSDEEDMQQGTGWDRGMTEKKEIGEGHQTPMGHTAKEGSDVEEVGERTGSLPCGEENNDVVKRNALGKETSEEGNQVSVKARILSFEGGLSLERHIGKESSDFQEMRVQRLDHELQNGCDRYKELEGTSEVQSDRPLMRGPIGTAEVGPGSPPRVPLEGVRGIMVSETPGHAVSETASPPLSAARNLTENVEEGASEAEDAFKFRKQGEPFIESSQEATSECTVREASSPAGEFLPAEDVVEPASENDTSLASQQSLAVATQRETESADDLKVCPGSPEHWPRDEEFPREHSVIGFPRPSSEGEMSGHTQNESQSVDQKDAFDLSKRGELAADPSLTRTPRSSVSPTSSRESPPRNDTLDTLVKEDVVLPKGEEAGRLGRAYITASSSPPRVLMDKDRRYAESDVEHLPFRGNAVQSLQHSSILRPDGGTPYESSEENYITILPSRTRKNGSSDIPETVSEVRPGSQEVSDQETRSAGEKETGQMKYMPSKGDPSSPDNKPKVELSGKGERSFNFSRRSPSIESNSRLSSGTRAVHPMATFNSNSNRHGESTEDMSFDTADFHDARESFDDQIFRNGPSDLRSNRTLSRDVESFNDQSLRNGPSDLRSNRTLSRDVKSFDAQTLRNGPSDLRSNRTLSRDVDFEDEMFSGSPPNLNEMLVSRRRSMTLAEDIAQLDMQDSDEESFFESQYYSGSLHGSSTSRYLVDELSSPSYHEGEAADTDDELEIEDIPDAELWEGQGEPIISCQGLDFADSMGLTKLNYRLRFLINWLVNSLLKLRHPGPNQGIPLVRIYGPKVKYDRGAAVSFNMFDWKGVLIQPGLVQRLADRSNISLGVGRLCNIVDPDMLPDFLAEKERLLEVDKSDQGSVDSYPYSGKLDNGRNPLRIPVVTAAMGFVSSFEDVYRLWSFLAKFLDADFVSKEVWRYHSLNQQTIVM